MLFYMPGKVSNLIFILSIAMLVLMRMVHFQYSYSGMKFPFHRPVLTVSNSNPILKPRVPLNVLWIIFDDLRPALGVLGDPIALTPHLDQLGEKSTVFTEAFCQYPLCGPSRISVLTSRRPDTLLSYFNGYPINQTGTFVTFPQYFKEHGVVTASFGKVFHVEDDILFDWDRVWSSKPWFPSQNHSSVESECSRAQGQAQFKLMCPVDLSTHPSAFFADNELVRKVSEFFRNWAETARSNRDQSFFAAVGMHLPHVPFKFPEPYLSAYPLERVKPMPDVENVDFSPEIRQYTRRLFRKWNFLGKNLDPSRFNDRFRHQFKQHYYAAVSFVDRQIGTLLKSLVAAGLDENTIICLTSDHGFALGEHGLIGKQYIYDVTTRVPWMIRHPSASGSLRNFSIVPLEQLHRVASQTRRRPLKSVAQPVESLDIFPTLADLAGIPAPPRCPVFNGMLSRKQPLCVEGTSQAQEVLDHSYPNPRVTNRSLRVAYSLTTQGQLMGRQKRNISMIMYSARDHQYRYIESFAFNLSSYSPLFKQSLHRELFDHVNDPDELHNITGLSKYKEVVDYFSKQIRSYFDVKNTSNHHP